MKTLINLALALSICTLVGLLAVTATHSWAVNMLIAAMICDLLLEIVPLLETKRAMDDTGKFHRRRDDLVLRKEGSDT
jgi:hypothetical protein